MGIKGTAEGRKTKFTFSTLKKDGHVPKIKFTIELPS